MTEKYLFQKEATVVDVPDDTNDDDDDIHMIEPETVAPRNGAKKMCDGNLHRTGFVLVPFIYHISFLFSSLY